MYVEWCEWAVDLLEAAAARAGRRRARAPAGEVREDPGLRRWLAGQGRMGDRAGRFQTEEWVAPP